MAQNPLLGNRISLISKKNIRYEGTLYSINESDATVALADVRSYGTEGREKFDASVSYVPPQDAVHPYLLFRGCDIKDLHVHERIGEGCITQPAPPSDPAIVSTEVPLDIQNNNQANLKDQSQPPTPSQSTNQTKKPATPTVNSNKGNKISSEDKTGTSQRAVDPSSANKKQDTKKGEARQALPSTNEKISKHRNDEHGQQDKNREHHPQRQKQSWESKTSTDGHHKYQNGIVSRHQPHRSYNSSRGGSTRRPRRTDTKIGTGASLLNRKARGAVTGGGPEPPPVDDFDFEISAAQFKEKTNDEEDDDYDEELGNATNTYSKDDFFDCISCDALDKQSGVDSRLRGAAERSLNMDTFGAVSLGNGRRSGRRNRRRGGGSGRVFTRQPGRGRQGGERGVERNGVERRGGDFGPLPRENQRWKRAASSNNRNVPFNAAHGNLTRAGGES